MSGGFTPKGEQPELAPPKDDPISTTDLALCDGSHEGKPIYVAIKGELGYLRLDVHGRIRSTILQERCSMSRQRRRCMDPVQAIMCVAWSALSAEQQLTTISFS